MPIQDEKEDVVVRDWIYREGKYMHNENFTPSPKSYGWGYTFVKKMGYPRHGPLSNRLDARTKPFDYGLFRCKSKQLVVLGYANHNNVSPILDKLHSEEEQEYIPNLENQ